MTCHKIVPAALLAAITVAVTATNAPGHITGWITINNDGESTAPANIVIDGENSTTITGDDGYQALAAFPTITLEPGQYIELTGTLSALGRGMGAANSLQSLRDQIRFGLFRAPEGDPIQAENLTGYIIEHRSETREIRNPVPALSPPADNSPFVSGRSSEISNDGHSTAADPQFTSGTGNMNFTESDVVAGVDVSFMVTYRITRDGNNLDITASIAGTPGVVDPNATDPPGPGDGIFLEQFSLQDVDPAINLSGEGSDNFDFKFNRIGILVGGNVGLAQTLVANFNADDDVNDADLALWAAEFGAGAGGDADMDFDSDGNDFLLWQQNFGRSKGHVVLTDFEVTTGNIVATAAAVPEPGTAVLLLAGGSIMALRRRRR